MRFDENMRRDKNMTQVKNTRKNMRQLKNMTLHFLTDFLTAIIMQLTMFCIPQEARKYMSGTFSFQKKINSKRKVYSCEKV